jgi:hypothetical protein
MKITDGMRREENTVQSPTSTTTTKKKKTIMRATMRDMTIKKALISYWPESVAINNDNR